MLTLAFGMMVFSLIWNLRDITGGDDGLVGIMKAPIALGIFSIPINKPQYFFFLVLFCLVLSVVLIHRIRHSPFGLVLSGIRENDKRVEFAGVSLKNYRLGAFVVSGKQYRSLFGPLEPFGRTGPGQLDRRYPDVCRSHRRQRDFYCSARDHRTLHPELDAVVCHYSIVYYYGISRRRGGRNPETAEIVFVRGNMWGRRYWLSKN
jgi:hypothetical protein